MILFLAGLQLALVSRDAGAEKADGFVILATSAMAVLNVGLAVVFGILAHHGACRSRMRV